MRDGPAGRLRDGGGRDHMAALGAARTSTGKTFTFIKSTGYAVSCGSPGSADQLQHAMAGVAGSRLQPADAVQHTPSQTPPCPP